MAIFKEACKRNKVYGIFSITGEKHPEGKNPYNTMIMITDKGDINMVSQAQGMGLLAVVVAWAVVASNHIIVVSSTFLAIKPVYVKRCIVYACCIAVWWRR